ncbi:hypothetical protein AeMF1_005047, partial [Aphanomyces euteiches]
QSNLISSLIGPFPNLFTYSLQKDSWTLTFLHHFGIDHDPSKLEILGAFERALEERQVYVVHGRDSQRTTSRLCCQRRDTTCAVPTLCARNCASKVKAAEDAWNSRDAARVSLAYTQDTVWRNRDEIFVGRDAVVEFLTRKWVGVANYKLVKNLWCYDGNRIAVRFTYEYQRVSDGQWFRCHGNELWQFDEQGYMQHRDMSGNDIPIDEKDRLYSS